ncbi:valine--tRNA ligase [Myxococcota bacterium]|nr:valine--tRNA ligase [Myxococcota bacterium]MBU1429324.1 valine--tRNA ligase [Myxococcota bacterium]MBU1896600.1 valine--tRNA ligase [Myxococcota bacterium]
MDQENLSKVYDHRDVEPRWYARWMEKGYFKADANSDKPAFTLMIPPPNVTGALHMGHGLTFAIEDMLVRWKRMAGFNTLWLPGTDHAGIATQMLVERALIAEGQDRFELGREAFLDKVWAWKHVYHARITKQLQALGASCDWDRERFTMDEGLSRAVREVFVRLYEEGLIYQADRLVNWSPGCQTVISDLEVEHEERDSSMWHMAYPVADSDERLVVATTRPETMLGDTAVAVHPDDPRYQHLIGKEIMLPLANRRVPIIADGILVDMAFGTGAVKVTPAHDFNDFETGKRHGLEIIQVLDKDAKLNDNAPEKYRGMDRFEARKAIVADLDALGLLVKIEPHKLSVGTCQRSGAVVEPQLSKQWYVHIKPLAEEAARAVRDGRTQIVPEMWAKTYFHWMDNIQDWCISRQLWWGHRIPAWHCARCGGVTVSRQDATACKHCQSADIHQDEDVLDTWFSSGLWPFSTLGWPDKTADLKAFYPTQIMETGSDILFFWVARMMMMGLHFMGEVPFKTVYLHSMVRDEHGDKMSKTKGNVIDPLVISEKYGADSLRLTLILLAGHGRDIKLGERMIETGRNFINKVWNACRFALMNLSDYHADAPKPALASFSAVDLWILSRLDQTVETVNRHLDALDLNDAAMKIYQFFWSEFCDWYIELAKPVLYGQGEARRATQWTLVKVLDTALRLLHPIIPFASEEIWARLPLGEGRPEALMIAAYPKAEGVIDPRAEAEVERLMEIIKAIRNVRGELNIPLGKALDVTLRGDEAQRAEVAAHVELIKRLARVEALEINAPRPKGAAMQLAADWEVFVPLAGLIDFNEELARLDKALQKNQKALIQVQRKLGNAGFLAKAPDEVVAEQRQREADLLADQAKLAASQARIKALRAEG